MDNDTRDKFFDYFKNKCPKGFRHKLINNRCIKCKVNVSTADWKYGDEGTEYYDTYYIYYIIDDSKRKTMDIFNKITEDTYENLSKKFIDVMLSDIKYIEQADVIIKQILDKIIHPKFISIYAGLCKMLYDADFKCTSFNGTLTETFDILLANRLQKRYNMMLEDSAKKREMILLILFISNIENTHIFPRIIIDKILKELFRKINDKINIEMKYYYTELICTLLTDKLCDKKLVTDYLSDLKLIKTKFEKRNKRIYILILNLEEKIEKNKRRIRIFRKS